LFLWFSGPGGNLTVTTEEHPTIALNSSISGTFAGTQIVPFFIAVPEEEAHLIIISSQNTVYLWNQTSCSDSNYYFNLLQNNIILFCGVEFSNTLSADTPFYLRGENSPSTPYEINVTSFGFPGQYRHAWDTTSNITVFVNGPPFLPQTLEFRNPNETFTLTFSTESTFYSLHVFDGCTQIAWDCDRFEPTCTMTPFDFPYSNNMIRLLLLAQSSDNFTFTYTPSCGSFPEDLFCGSAELNTSSLYPVTVLNLTRAQRDYNQSLAFFDSEKMEEDCLSTLKRFACQKHFRPCNANTTELAILRCGICEQIQQSCGENSCFDEFCSLYFEKCSASKTTFMWHVLFVLLFLLFSA